jgi:hypothetical protein
MARYNEILVGRYNRMFQKLFGMKGGPPAPQLAGDVQPGFPLFSGVEHRYLESWEVFGTAVATVATAVQTNAVLLRNPVGSNMIAVVEKLTINSGIAQEIDLSVGASIVDLTTSFASTRRDSRCRPGGTLNPSSSVASPAALPGIIGRFNVILGTIYDIIQHEDQQIPILPGQGMQLNNTVANQTLIVSAWWRERFLEEGERT